MQLKGIKAGKLRHAVDETLERLGVDYVDLLYIHQPAGNWLAGYRQLEKAYKEGKAKSIGISNFEGKYIEELETKWEVVPRFIQVEAHPYFTQKELRKTLDKYGIKLMSWYPLGHGDTSLINEKVFAELGKKYGKTSAQIILRWHTQMGFVVIPGSKNVAHIKDNLDILDFELTDEEMAKIAALDKNERYYHRTDEQLVQFAGWRPSFEKSVRFTNHGDGPRGFFVFGETTGTDLVVFVRVFKNGATDKIYPINARINTLFVQKTQSHIEYSSVKCYYNIA